MIKETVDVIREVELEGEQIISDAKEQARHMKEQSVMDSNKYREEIMKKAHAQADADKNQLIDKCQIFEKQRETEIEQKCSRLKTQADGRMSEAVERVIELLV